MISNSPYHSLTLGDQVMHLYMEGLTGSKGLNKAFNPNMLFNCKIMGGNVWSQMKAYLELLVLQYL